MAMRVIELPHRRRADAARSSKAAPTSVAVRLPSAGVCSPNVTTPFAQFALNEPRGFDAMVGALLLRAGRPSMCGGAHLLQQRRVSGHVRPRRRSARRSRSSIWAASVEGAHRFETPVGIVGVDIARAQQGDHRQRAELCSQTRR